jgi:hypothetical protein
MLGELELSDALHRSTLYVALEFSMSYGKTTPPANCMRVTKRSDVGRAPTLVPHIRHPRLRKLRPSTCVVIYTPRIHKLRERQFWRRGGAGRAVIKRFANLFLHGANDGCGILIPKMHLMNRETMLIVIARMGF